MLDIESQSMAETFRTELRETRNGEVIYNLKVTTLVGRNVHTSCSYRHGVNADIDTNEATVEKVQSREKWS